MIDALHISETGLKSTQAWLDYLSNNVANMHTAGYKKANVNFQDIVSPSTLAPGADKANSAKSFSALGSKISEPVIDFSSGSLKSTGRALDVAIKGSGFLELITANGEFAYTRLGNLQVNEEGLLAVNGLALSDKIQIPENTKKIDVKANGVVVATYSDSDTTVELGQIQLANAINSTSFRPIGDAMYQIDESAEITLHQAGEDGTGEIQQGFIEMSNVDLVDEMTSLVMAQRAYQLNARLIQTADQILETINNLRR